MKNVFFTIPLIYFFSFPNRPLTSAKSSLAVNANTMKFNGVAPAMASAGKNVYMVFTSGDSIWHSLSTDKGNSFAAPLFAGYLPKLSTGGGRGPQIVSVKNKLIIAAADQAGDIYTFIKKDESGNWEKGKTINDIKGMAKEGFISLASNHKEEVFAVWLDLRQDNKNKIAGAITVDGGISWSKNRILYSSPDGTVCECCKPAVAMKDQLLVVMFRNWLNGNRDLYTIQSKDGGLNFEAALKLGEGSWKLNACPMDGGSLVIDADKTVHTVWHREDTIYTCLPGKKEKMIARGKQCIMTGSNDHQFVVFVWNGNVQCLSPDGKIQVLGKGNFPKLISVDDHQAVCAWEYNKQISWAVLKSN